MAKKKLSSLFIFLVILAVIGGIVYFKPFGETAVSCGSQGVLSIDRVSLTTSSNLNNKEVVRVSTVVNQNGECLKIDFNKGDMEKKLEESTNKDYSVDNPVTGDFSFKSQSQTNPVQIGSGTELYYQINDVIVKNAPLCTIKDGNNKKPKTTYTTIECKKESAFGDCHCFYSELIGERAKFGLSRDLNMEYDFTIDGLGTIPIKVTPTQNVISGKLGDKAFVRLEFSGLSSVWIDSLGQGYELFYDYSKQNFRIVDNQAYLDRKLGLSTAGSQIGKASVQYKDAVVLARTYNENLNQAISDKTSSILKKEKRLKSITPLGESYIVEFKNPVLYPVFTVELDAKWVGIHRVEGIPDVSCPTAGFTIRSGEFADYDFSVKNKAPAGQGNSKFTLGVNCENGATGILDKREVSLGGQESETIIATTGIITNKDVTATCTITASDVSSGKQDSCSYSFKGDFVEGGKECTSNICSGKDVIICESGKIKSRTTCDFGCFFENGLPKCASKVETEICNNGIDDDKDGLIDDKDPDCQLPPECKPLIDIKNPLKSTESWFKIDNPFCNLKERLAFISILLGVLTGLGALGIGLAKFKRKKDASLKVIVALFSVILGVLVYFLIQNAFDFIFSFWGIVTIFIVIVFLLFLGNIRKAIGV